MESERGTLGPVKLGSAADLHRARRVEVLMLELKINDGVASLRIDSTIDLDWARAWRDHAVTIASRADVRVVHISSSGRFFCPGGDLRWMAAQQDRRTALHELAAILHDGLLKLSSLDAPVVAEVQGTAAGAGMSIVLAADIALAASSATFVMAYTGVGLSPDGGASWMLPRLVGRRRALEIMLLDPHIDAPEAERLGIVTRTVPDAELRNTADAWVSRLAMGPTPAFGAVNRLLSRSSQTDFAAQLDLEALEIARLAAGHIGEEGILAFLEGRPPDFARIKPETET